MAPLDRRFEQVTVHSCDIERVDGQVGSEHTSLGEALCESDGERSRARTEIHDHVRRFRQSGSDLPEQLGLGSRYQHSPVDLKVPRTERGSPLEVLKRFARKPALDEHIQFGIGVRE